MVSDSWNRGPVIVRAISVRLNALHDLLSDELTLSNQSQTPFQTSRMDVAEIVRTLRPQRFSAQCRARRNPGGWRSLFDSIAGSGIDFAIGLKGLGATIPGMDGLVRLLTARELAAYLEVPVATLYAWRHRGAGPRAFRVGRHLRYRSSDVEEWIRHQLEDAKRRADADPILYLRGSQGGEKRSQRGTGAPSARSHP
ncbi:MAG: helix-turn-helix transcriptional regulator [Acidimicrobiia bacterium]